MGILDIFKRNKNNDLNNAPTHSEATGIALPIIFNEVIYIVAGQKAYEGDLVITRNVVYYVPHRDLINERITNLSDTAGAAVLGFGFAAARYYTGKSLKIVSKDNAGAPVEDLNASLEDKLDAYIKERKENQSLLANSMPVPMRFMRSGIENLRFSHHGLSFDANFDDHRFLTKNARQIQSAFVLQ